MKAIIFLVVTVTYFTLTLSESALAGGQSIKVGPYVLTYDHTFCSSDDGVTIRFDVQPDIGSEISCKSETGVYSPVFIALKVNGMLMSGSVSTFFSNEERCVLPYILFDLTVSKYQEIAGREWEVTLITPERPHHGNNWYGRGSVFFTPTI